MSVCEGILVCACGCACVSLNMCVHECMYVCMYVNNLLFIVYVLLFLCG